MSYDSLGIICNDVNEALLAGVKIAPQINLRKFYIFVGNKPSNESLNWMNETDSYICLEKASIWSKNLSELCSRASALYSGGWNFVLFYANNLPNEEDIENARNSLIKDSSPFFNNKLWAFTLEDILFNDFDYIYPKSMEEENIEFEELEIGKAMRGEEVSLNIFVKAIVENISLKGVSIAYETIELSSINNIIVEISKHIKDVDNITPTMFILGDKVTEESIQKYQRKIPKNGMILLIVKNKLDFHLTFPYKTFKAKEGFFGYLFHYKN